VGREIFVGVGIGFTMDFAPDVATVALDLQWIEKVGRRIKPSQFAGAVIDVANAEPLQSETVVGET
jgi:hypothetical protein